MAWELSPLAAIEVGGYLSLWKMIVPLLLLLGWLRLLTWVDKDTTVAYLPREPLNAGMFGGAVLAVLLFFALPGFWIAFGAMFFIFAAEVGTYLILRSKKVGLADLKDEIKKAFQSKKKKEKEHQASAGEVGLMNKKGAVITPPPAESPDAPSYMAVQQLLSDAMIRGAERIDMAPAEGVAAVRYQVDGVAYNSTSLDMNASQSAVAYLKRLAGLDLEERRKPQKGTMKVAVGGTRHELEVHTAGSAAGEFLKIFVNPKKRHSLRLEELGMTQDQLAKMRELVADPAGIVIVSAPRGLGLTSTNYGIIRAHDAFLTHIQTVERAPEEDLEGITQNALSANANAEEEFKQVDWVCSQQPDVILLTLIESPQSAQSLIRFAAEGKRVYVGMRAGSTLQALDMWRKLVGDDASAMKHLKMVISGRVMRRLCNACKVGYSPDPETVRKLNLDPARVSTLFQARTEPMRDPKGNPIPCNFCKELRYKGRFGVFELLQIDDDVRQIVEAGGSVNQLKAVFRKQRGRFLQEVALLQVSEGETSIQEMLRVLRADQPAATQQPPSASRPASAAPRSATAPRTAAQRPQPRQPPPRQ